MSWWEEDDRWKTGRADTGQASKVIFRVTESLRPPPSIASTVRERVEPDSLWAALITPTINTESYSLVFTVYCLQFTAHSSRLEALFPYLLAHSYSNVRRRLSFNIAPYISTIRILEIKKNLFHQQIVTHYILPVSLCRLNLATLRPCKE